MHNNHDNSNVLIEEGIIAGNYYDKYGTNNPVARLLMKNFFSEVNSLVGISKCMEIHEIGCGEGHLSRMLAKNNLRVRGSDFSRQVVEKAIAISVKEDIDVPFKAASIYDMNPSADAAELIVCCEVLEHLDDPEKALAIISQLAKPYLLVSVPREPLWCILNLVRGKYLTHGGNTPGHIQHWSRGSFIKFLSMYFDVIEIRTPTPWVVALCSVKNAF